MPYTFKPKEKHAKAYSTLFISPKDSKIICRVIRKKKLNTSRRLLDDLITRKRSLEGKYYTKAVEAIRKLLASCEKNAESLGLEKERLFIYASSCTGPKMRRSRRKSDFGRELKVSNVEIILVEKGKEKKPTPKKAPEKKQEQESAKK